MKSVLLIGLGNFGQALGERLKNMGDEVMIVDRNEDLINSLSSKYTGAAIANCMNVDNLKALDIPSCRYRRRFSKLARNHLEFKGFGREICRFPR